MSLFENRSASPMLLTESEPFDSENHIYELKLDGIRCLAYLDQFQTELRNKRNKILNNTYPELKNINKSVKQRCILDGELVVITNGKPDFFEVQKRSLMTNQFKIELSAKQRPVRFVAYDIIYLNDKSLVNTKLLERKKLLEETVNEDESLAISRFIHDQGINFYNLVAKQDLEGVVAKKKDSYYYFAKR
ncbi:MAG: dependent ligase, partial [Haloplasmataceae bacterium]|nr:dependent ligase [Haloplasmataceae bacterium]